MGVNGMVKYGMGGKLGSLADLGGEGGVFVYGVESSATGELERNLGDEIETRSWSTRL